MPPTLTGTDGRQFSTEKRLIDWVSRYLASLVYVPDNPAQQPLHIFRWLCEYNSKFLELPFIYRTAVTHAVSTSDPLSISCVDVFIVHFLEFDKISLSESCVLLSNLTNIGRVVVILKLEEFY